MTSLPDHLTRQHLDALVSGVQAVAQIEGMIRQLEYLRTAQFASLSQVTVQIARDEQHPDHGAHLHRAVEAEVAAATRSTHALASARIAHATPLVRDYPAVTAAFREGLISLRHTEVITDAGQIISIPNARGKFESEVLPLAVSMTPAQLRAHARRLAEHFADRSIDERHAEARTRRSVQVTPLDDGMAQLVAVLGAAEAFAIKDRVARLAKAVLRTETNRNTDTSTSSAASTSSDIDVSASRRTRFQTQADVFVQLLLADHNGCSTTDGNAAVHSTAVSNAPISSAPSASPDSVGASTDTNTNTNTNTNANARSLVKLPVELLQQITGHVQVTIPVFTLAAIHGSKAAPYAGPAELAGYGPIDRNSARRLAGNAPGWDRILTHPISGTVLAVDRYRPTEDLKRYLRARDQHCRFPGCTRPAMSCDIDHTVPAQQGGETSRENTGHLCRAHHTLKHATLLGSHGWTPMQTGNGDYKWTSLTGNTYRTTPASTVRFRPVQVHTVMGPDTSGPVGTGPVGTGPIGTGPGSTSPDQSRFGDGVDSVGRNSAEPP